MSIPFNSIPSSLRVPFVGVEFDATRAQQGPALLAYRALLIGQKLTAGTAEANAVVRCTSVDQAIALAGRGSMLHRQALALAEACSHLLAGEQAGYWHTHSAIEEVYLFLTGQGEMGLDDEVVPVFLAAFHFRLLIVRSC